MTTTNPDRVVKALEKGPATLSGIVSETGLSSDTARNAVRALLRRREIVRNPGPTGADGKPTSSVLSILKANRPVVYRAAASVVGNVLSDDVSLMAGSIFIRCCRSRESDGRGVVVAIGDDGTLYAPMVDAKAAIREIDRPGWIIGRYTASGLTQEFIESDIRHEIDGRGFKIAA